VALPCGAAADPDAIVCPDEENRLATQLTPEDNRPGDSLLAAVDVGADEADEVDEVDEVDAGPGVGALTAGEVGAAAIFSGAAK
jgi:hypothetical protein